MPRYEWTGADAFADNANDRLVEPGDIVELDAHVGDPQPEFVRVEDEDSTAADADSSTDSDADSDAEEAADEEETAADETDPPFDPAEYSVGDLRDALSDSDYSAAELDALEAAERADGSPRTTALDAIDAARE